MIISATISNSEKYNELTVSTNQSLKQLDIPAKTEGRGSGINGGELLFAAIATCFCNDIYREASKRKILVRSVEVKVSGQFGGEGEPGSNIQYEAKVDAEATDEELDELIAYVDRIAEIHNTIRKGTEVRLKRS